jgi:prepilin-type N-terminal cleavage/methylation domain-containing protein
MRIRLNHHHGILQTGFTLIEVLVVVVIVAILAGIALPAYSSYVLRGKIVEATNDLSSIRAAMEQYYQDNRTYQDVSAVILSPCNPANYPATKYFALSCPVQTATTYTILATGKDTTTIGFSYSITNANVQSSTVGASWGGATYNCWIVKNGTTC